jgi:hypothetical protein
MRTVDNSVVVQIEKPYAPEAGCRQLPANKPADVGVLPTTAWQLRLEVVVSKQVDWIRSAIMLCELGGQAVVKGITEPERFTDEIERADASDAAHRYVDDHPVKWAPRLRPMNAREPKGQTQENIDNVGDCGTTLAEGEGSVKPE